MLLCCSWRCWNRKILSSSIGLCLVMSKWAIDDSFPTKWQANEPECGSWAPSSAISCLCGNRCFDEILVSTRMMTVNKFDIEAKIYLYRYIHVYLYIYIYKYMFCICVSLQLWAFFGCFLICPRRPPKTRKTICPTLSGDLDDVAEQRRKNKQQEQEATNEVRPVDPG